MLEQYYNKELTKLTLADDFNKDLTNVSLPSYININAIVD